jgi:hypothetical protein
LNFASEKSTVHWGDLTGRDMRRVSRLMLGPAPIVSWRDPAEIQDGIPLCSPNNALAKEITSRANAVPVFFASERQLNKYCCRSRRISRIKPISKAYEWTVEENGA